MLEAGILARVAGCRVNGEPSRRIYNTSNISFDYIEGEAMQMVLNSRGIAVSTGSACASGTDTPSRTLSAMGLDAVCARGAVRMSLGYGITEEDVDYCIEAIAETALRLQEISPLKP
jgi:cysteine desulfurase